MATIILAVVAAILGPRQFPSGPKPARDDPHPDSISGAGRPVDGDSLFVNSNEVRLKGIDAPEGRQTCTRDGADWACGDAARDELRRLIGKSVVTCQVLERDQHGRMLSICKAGGQDLNGAMVASGLAVSYGGYHAEEAAAKRARRGLWAGEFTMPRDWRREHGVGGH